MITAPTCPLSAIWGLKIKELTTNKIINDKYYIPSDPKKDIAESHTKPTPSPNLNLENPDAFMVVTQYDYAEYRCKPGKFFGNRESVFKLMYSGAAYDATLLPRWVAITMPEVKS